MATPAERKLIEDWLDEESQSLDTQPGQTALKMALFSAIDDDGDWLYNQLGRTAKRIDPRLFEPDR